MLSLLGEHLTHAEIAARLFVSVRTVESHVAALRRKLGISGHRELVRYAASRVDPQSSGTLRHVRPGEGVTRFVGRDRERRELAEAVQSHRLVSVVGPGGAGKTRLALAVADDVGSAFDDRVWQVDLVPVTDEATLSSAIATACGMADTPGRSTLDALARTFRRGTCLLVLDNCEHVINAVAVMVESLISRCTELHVLVTTRARLVIPFERVFALAGMTTPGEALALFVERATAAGWEQPDAEQRVRMERICAAVDCLPLAIELAAVRLPSLGLAGVEHGLADQSTLLVGGARAHSRQRSMTETLVWSFRLLGDTEQRTLCRAAAFAGAFDASAAAQVVAGTDVSPEAVMSALSTLVDHSLLVPVLGAPDRRWRILEPIRQCAFAQMLPADRDAHRAHCDWARTQVAGLLRVSAMGGRRWLADFDDVADEVRAALAWLISQGELTDEAHRLAHDLALLLFRAGHLREAQRRFEQAAQLALPPQVKVQRLIDASGVARCRVLGEEAFRLDIAAVELCRASDDRDLLALSLARGAETIFRFEGMFAGPVPVDIGTAMRDEVIRISGDIAAYTAAHVVALSRTDPSDPRSSAEAGRALRLAAEAGDRVRQSAAMDVLTGTYLMGGHLRDAADCARRRVALVSGQPLEPGIALELKDALHMATLCCLGVGDVPGAVTHAAAHMELAFLREQGDLGIESMLAPNALSGDWATVVNAGELFKEDWVAAGRPPAPGRAIGPCAVAMVHGAMGRDDQRHEWLDIVGELMRIPTAQINAVSGFGAMFEGMMLLHRGEPDAALRTLTGDVAPGWYAQLLSQLHAAFLAEAAVLSGSADAPWYVDQARSVVARNQLAELIVDRAVKIARAEWGEMGQLVERFSAAGVPYQAERTAVLANADSVKRRTRS